MDFKGAKNYKPGAYETFSDNLGDMLIDLLNGDEKLLNSPEIQALGASNVKAALEWLATADINGDYKDLIANEGWRLMYKRKPPRPEEFLTWDWIGAQSEGLWPNVRHAFEEFCNPDPLNPKRGLALSTSIGWGKSLLTNLCMSYIITHFCLMREPYKVLGHSQPVYEKVKLPSGKYTTIGDLKIGQEIAGVLKDTSKIIDIYDQGEKETYELTFDDNTTCKCSLDHYWTVYDFSNQNYIVLKTKDIINNVDRYGFPDLEDCKRDREAILAAEQYFENTNYQRIDLDIDQVILEVSMLQKILFSEDIKGVYNRESFYKKYQKEIDNIYENSKGRISKRRHSYFYDNQYFDSSDELTFYVYRKFYDTPVKRNVANNINSFYVEYEANGKKHKAFPDFVDEQGNYYEIKGKHLLDENGNFINPFTTDPSVLETFKQKGEALKKAKVIILDSNKIKCMQRVLLQEKQIDTTSKSPYRKDLTKKEYIQFLWDIYKKDHKMDYNPNRACFKPIFNTFKQDLPIKFEDIPSIEKTCDRIWGRQRVSCTCKSCGTFFEKTYITLKNHEMLELCKSCLQKHVAQNRSQEIKELRSKRLSEKLKAVRQTKNDEIVAKRNATIVERYGSKENLVKIVTEKARATNYEKYGIASLTAAMNLKNKEKQNCEKTC